MGGGGIAAGTMNQRAWLIGFLRLALAGVLGWASVAKASNLPAFAEGVAGFGLFPELAIPWLTFSVPVLEALVALLLLTRLGYRPAALLTGLLALGFMLLFTWAGLRGEEVTCSCFGGTGVTPIWWGLIRSGGLFLAAMVVYGSALQMSAGISQRRTV